MIDLLCDRTKQLAILINCNLKSDRILCGYAYFKGGISGNCEVFDSTGNCFAIAIPEEVSKVFTFVAIASANNNLEIFYASEEKPI